MKNWISHHKGILIFAVIFTVLPLISLIPPIESIFIWQRFFQAIAQIIHGFANLLFVVGSFLPKPLDTVGFYVALFIYGVLYGLALVKLWKWRIWLGKFLATLLLLINAFLGLFITSFSDTLIGKSYAACNKAISDTVIVRIAAYPEIGVIPGSYHFYSMSTDAGKTWQQFMYFRHDDPVEPFCNNIQSRTSSHIWAWMGWQVAVTKDAGNSWHIWMPESTWSDWTCCNYKLVEQVTFQDEKTGYMRLDPSKGRGEAVILETQDGGETWKQ